MASGRLVAIWAVLAVVAGCGFSESRFNPFNWFGSSTVEDPTLAPVGGFPEDAADQRPLVAQVTEMRVDRVPGGAIVHATGLPPVQGFWSADLVAEITDAEGRPVPENGTLALQFRVLPPVQATRSGPALSRELTAALFLSDQTLARVGTITVRGQTNQRSSRR
ncbi:MAG: hypothetical protein AAFR44_12170 [Pseudomonadota bacterium]